ncbi:hypothetical protein HK101_003328 [Irineochytrium annulatum]|nr:hypothetical protein HK101_003328 [Irineochytrium annulatum]
MPPAPSSSPAAPSADSLLTFLLLIGRLKTTKRAGWVRNSIHLPESIADHMHRMGVMSLVMSSLPVSAESERPPDMNRVVRMSIVHDLAECIVGDITPHDGVADSTKYDLESRAMDELVKDLGAEGSEIRALWEEYEAGVTEEARLVKDLDKLEMLVQAYEYEKDQGVELGEFFESTVGRIKTTTGKMVLEALVRRREGLLEGRDKDGGKV